MMETLRRILGFFEAVGQVVAVVLVVAGLAGCCWLAWLGRQSRRLPPVLSPHGGPLLARGDRPNWVSTTALPRDALHYLPPRPCPVNPLPRIEEHLRREGGVLVTVSEHYLHATCASRRFGLVDDVEVLYDPKAGLLHARSASRVGYADFGVNRRRLEAIFRAMEPA
jgi:uncharacterized protein (DUF1499 family)